MMSTDESRAALFPRRVKPWVVGFAVLLAGAGVAAILWRGPAILIDLQTLASWCF